MNEELKVVVIPTYNEAENVKLLANQIFDLGVGNLKILFIDDNSPDGTSSIIESLSREYPERVFLIKRSGKLGLGTAYLEGFRRALDMEAEYVIQMDADFSHSPKYILEFLEQIKNEHNNFDVIVGSRYVKGGGVDKSWSLYRKALSAFANKIYVSSILRLKVKDTTAGFKCWHRSTLENLGLERIRSNGYVFLVEMAYLTEKLGFKVLEIPIYFEDRSNGHSKMSLKVKIESAIYTWQIPFRHWKIERR